ncbi:hypothetical protein HK096_010302 [Nowakowskiella sp. JEL0078]|nr:hypothetical protein HK096_010302 [Nowakowskiella sp. JEL0078]
MEKQYPLSPQLYIDLLEFFIQHDSINNVLSITREAKFNGLLKNEDFWVRYLEIRKSISMIKKDSHEDDKVGKSVRNQCRLLILEFENPIIVSNSKLGEQCALISPNLKYAYSIAIDLELRLTNLSKAKEYIMILSKLAIGKQRLASIPISTANNLLSTSLEKSTEEMSCAIEFLKNVGLDIHKVGNTHTYNILIKFHIKSGDHEGALKLFNKLCEIYFSMKEKSIHELKKTFQDTNITNFDCFIPPLIGPNEYTLNLILNSFIGKASISEVKAVWRKALNCGVKPNLFCFSSMMKVHEKNGEPESALHLLKKVQNSGFVPDTEMYSIAISAAMKLHAKPKIDTINENALESNLPVSSIEIHPSDLPVISRHRIRHATSILSDMNAFKMISSRKVNLALFSTLLELNDLPTSLHMLKLLYPLESVRLKNIPTVLVTNIIALCSNYPQTGIEIYESYGDHRLACLKATLSNLIIKDTNSRPEQLKWRKSEGIRLIEEYKSYEGTRFIAGNELDFIGFGLMIKLQMMGWDINDVRKSEKMFWEFMATHRNVKTVEIKSDSMNFHENSEDTYKEVAYIKALVKEPPASLVRKLSNGVSVREFIISIHSLMNGYAKCGDIRACMRVCEQAAEFIPKNRTSNNKEDLPLEINERDIDTATRNIVMDASCRSIQLATSINQKEKAAMKVKELFNRSVEKHYVDEATLCIYIDMHSLWKSEDLDNAILLVRKIAKDLSLETITVSGAIGLPLNVYNSIIEAFAKAQRWGDIPSILFEMLKADLPVLEKTVTSINAGPEGEERSKCISFAKVVSGIEREFSTE